MFGPRPFSSLSKLLIGAWTRCTVSCSCGTDLLWQKAGGPAYNRESRHELFSLSKSFTSTAVGFAVAEGKLSIDDEVLKFFPDEAPAEPGANLKSMRVRDLLCMSTGHQTEPRLTPTNELAWTETFLAHPVPHKPGTHFLYNTAATYMQSAIVQKVTGLTVLEYLRPRLFEPLGIIEPTWGLSPQGICLGGYGLSIRTEDIAKFGQLYLQKGQWLGMQVAPADWIQAATTRQTSNGSNPKSDWDQGYGFQFWRCRHGAYRGDGAFGQFCIVLPEQDAVVAITSGTKDMQGVLNLIWDKLLPAMGSAPLAANDDAWKQLEHALSNLVLPAPQGAPSSPLSERVSGQQFVFPANEQTIEGVVLERADDGVAITIRAKGADQRIVCGRKHWQKGRLAYGAFSEQPVAASGAWTAEDTYTAKICFYETPTCLTIQLRFAGNDVQYNAEYNVAFGPTRQPSLTGVRQ